MELPPLGFAVAYDLSYRQLRLLPIKGCHLLPSPMMLVIFSAINKLDTEDREWVWGDFSVMCGVAFSFTWP